MRDIKFRGECVEEGTWKYGNLVVVFGYAYIHTVNTGQTSPTAYRVKPDTIGQFTGIQDSNGVGIYEGDTIYLAGYGDCEMEFPFFELYDAAAELDIGAITGNVHELLGAK